jgi:hypothetical protein
MLLVYMATTLKLNEWPVPWPREGLKDSDKIPVRSRLRLATHMNGILGIF